MKRIMTLLILFLAGCVGIPGKVKPVGNFHVNRYLGKWYEIARLDHPFERGLTRVTGEYSLREDGGIRVLNRGYSASEGKWKEAVGKAFSVGSRDVGHLKVSFFGPFYGSYVILDLDHENYSHALVCGPNRSYLWILARNPRIDDSVKTRLTAKAAALGFDTSNLIFVDQHSST